MLFLSGGKEDIMPESLCKTCSNIFDFPKCCEENLNDSLKVVSSCSNYNKCGLIRDCLSCSNSHSETTDKGDILHCMEQGGKIVKDDEFCSKWN